MSNRSEGQADNSSRVVKVELAKQLILIAVIVAIAVWQHHFVIQAASADIYIFALLFGAAIFGFYNTIRGTFGLKNEFVALSALKQIYEDARRERSEPEDHRRIVSERMTKPNVIYNPPTALGTAHKLIYVELLRNGALSIPPATMQVLVSDLETKLDERQGMTHYLGALMVLLGLLGTFIGLMHTLESVGGILGSLDLSGNGGAGAIANLIESLKLPLEGMATGFGASLFGLIGSLVIGVLGKFDSRAAHHLQHDFETWLRNTVQIDAPPQSNGVVATSVEGDAAATSTSWSAALNVARNTVLATSRMIERQGEMQEELERLQEKASERDRRLDLSLSRAVNVLEESLLRQTQMAEGLQELRQSMLEASGDFSALLMKGKAAFDARFTENRLFLEKSALHEGKVESTIDELVQRLSQVSDQLRSIDGRVRKGFENRVRDAVTEQQEELVADFKHLVSTMRLRTEDVATIRKLSQLLQEGSTSPDGDTVTTIEKGVA
ncbi:biopolymer transport protein ExbB/TolQ/archaellum component FlaC [Agrobacterium larrymoorei]|uniref:Biopolymer transport protein ExbB/TolQ/archaellum component FlaC n=1 Tax=Agrobacterium larrymoorei TaxID=160699 RepID=A0AAJ2B7M9_9HYPH|nr:hypothetical protein [Agrobacterium larrymoorei]MDR6100905.1 biopolymer transport protein ExbB/TolQ/archaellum component FlaC [Agrobacterium larrymoorei]